MSVTWIDNLAVGDLVVNKSEGLPALVLDEQETARAKYGNTVNKRYRFRLYLSDGEQGWITETSFRALYKLP